jgi:hypothetical protein
MTASLAHRRAPKLHGGRQENWNGKKGDGEEGGWKEKGREP